MLPNEFYERAGGETMKTICIIQARMGSSRLPGKSMATIMGKPMLWHVIQRIKRCREIDDVVVATTFMPEDKKIVKFCDSENVKVTIGSIDDVLERYYDAAERFDADIVVRVTADCPLIDAGIIDRMVRMLKDDHTPNLLKYVSNSHPKTFPVGLDAEVMTFQALKKADEEATLPSEREHVTPYIWKSPDKFKLGNLTLAEYAGADMVKMNGLKANMADICWTVDYAADLETIRGIYSAMEPMRSTYHYFDWLTCLDIIRRHPMLRKNEGRDYEEGYHKSVDAEKNGICDGCNRPLDGRICEVCRVYVGGE